MALITKEHLKMVLQLLSRKPDKTEVVLKEDLEEVAAIELATTMGLVDPVSDENGAVYVDEKGAIYSL